MSAYDCPVNADEVFCAMLQGQFRELSPQECAKFNIDYSGYVWRQNFDVIVLCEHSPSGLRFNVRAEVSPPHSSVYTEVWELALPLLTGEFKSIRR